MIVDDCEGPLGPRMGDCKMITTESLNPRGDVIKRNPKSSQKVEIEEVKLFGDHND